MSAHEIVIGIMAIFALLGAADRIFGNRFGLGKEFEEGILAMGSLAMAMLGMIREDVRLPLVPMQPANKEKMAGVMRDLGLLK